MKADFYTEVYNIVKEIPEGNVVTYGQLAKLARRPQCSRMVGQAMFNAPRELNLPCHRVVNSYICILQRIPLSAQWLIARTILGLLRLISLSRSFPQKTPSVKAITPKPTVSREISAEQALTPRLAHRPAS